MKTRHKIVLGCLVGGMLSLIGLILFISPQRSTANQTGKVTYQTNYFSPNDKLVVNAIPDPKVEGVQCWVSRPEVGGWTGAMGLAENPSDSSLACRQTGPIRFTGKFAMNEIMNVEARNFTFKQMRIVRMCDPQNNTLVYLVYTTHEYSKEGSQKHAISAVPIQPWGDQSVVRCKDNVT